jgi:hypothetical protein
VTGGDPTDDLYALPAEEFVRARDALARDLAKAGRRDESQQVRALRRPSRSAAALNMIARTRRDDLQAVLDGGAAMRTALQTGDRDAWEAARADATQRISELAEAAAGAEAAQREVADSLWAAVADEEAAANLMAGRLEQPLSNPGLSGLAGLTLQAPSQRRPAKAAKASAAAKAPAPKPDTAAAERRRRLAETEVERARERLAQARAAVEFAESALRGAEEQLRRVSR